MMVYLYSIGLAAFSISSISIFDVSEGFFSTFLLHFINLFPSSDQLPQPLILVSTACMPLLPKRRFLKEVVKGLLKP